MWLALLLSCADDPKSFPRGDADADADADTDADSDADADADSDADPGCESACDCGEGELCYAGACEAASADLGAWTAALDRVVAALDPATGAFSEENAYPTEALLTLASAAGVLCRDDYADAAQSRASYAQDREGDDHLLPWDPGGYVSRDIQARHIYNLWAAGHALGDPDLRAAADAAAQAMLALERQEHGGFTLFCTTYAIDPPHACQSPPWIDVNQNSEVGMAFAVLAMDPGSALHGDPDALDAAAEELAAAVSVQAESGAIPIAESGGYEDDYDTLYGSYAAFSWAIAASALPDDAWLEDGVALAAAWLAPLSDGDPESHRTYPHPYDGDISPFEGSVRIPTLHRAGQLDPAFVAHWWDLVAETGETGTLYLPVSLLVRAEVPLEAIVRPE